jgi:predicted nucleic acid-binding protein
VAKLRRGRRGLGGTLVLDAEGLRELADGNPRAVSFAKDAYVANAIVLTVASALTEVLRGGPRDAPVHRILKDVSVVPVGPEEGRAAGELLGRTGLSGHRCALDALLAVVALAQPRPVVVLTSDTDDLQRLTDEPGRRRTERVGVSRI